MKEEQKQAVVERAKECCEYCWRQTQFSPDSFSIEHIVPRSRAGTSELSNLALACQGCNNRKYTSVEAIDFEINMRAFMVIELEPEALHGRSGVVKYLPEFSRV